MNFSYTKEQEDFKQEVHRFLAEESELTKKVRAEEDSGIGWGPYTWEFMRKAGARGYLTPSWPKKYGGLDKSPMAKHIAAEEMSHSLGLIASGLVGAGMAGPVVLLFGSDEHKEAYLPRIARGEIEFALGYTEPQAGSDLASLEMRAVRDGDHYIVNGQKTFNSACHYAQYHWLAARTNPDVSKHRGISLFIVDMDSPGITISPLIGLGKLRVNEVFYDDVRVPAERLVGEENRGWEYLVTALSFERDWLVGHSMHYFEILLDYVRHTRRNGKPIIDDPIVQRDLAQLAIDLEVVHLFGLRIACMLEKDSIPSYEAAMAKVFGSEVWHRVLDRWMELLSLYGQLDAHSDRVILQGQVMQGYFASVRSLLSRGTNDIMRSMIAQIGLGMPRR